MQTDFRQDRPYRRGLILGLTVAEVMILLLFILLMLLGYVLAERQKRIEVLDNGGANLILDELSVAYPDAETSDDYWKELRRAIEVRSQVERDGAETAGQSLLDEAALGRQLQDAFAAARRDGFDANSDRKNGQRQPSSLESEAQTAEQQTKSEFSDAELGRMMRDALAETGWNDPSEFIEHAELGARVTRATDGQSQIDARTVADDLNLGRSTRDAASRAGISDPSRLIAEAAAASQRGKEGEWPPFFSLSEAGGYYFDSGKATLRPEFEDQLDRIVIPLLAEYIVDYDVDVVEVIGHTDEVPMRGSSNLDDRLIRSVEGAFPISGLRSNDNAGLAMARAVSVSTTLRRDPRLGNVTVLPLSGAQMIVPVDRIADGSQTGSDRNRRRIEIRLRRSVEQADADGLAVVDGSPQE